jgi:predicted DNA-binding antitoxin AbrB/MazE fold protein
MKSIIWLLVPLLLLSVMAIAHAQENNVTTNATTGEQLQEATDLNDSDVGGFKLLVQELKVMFTSNQERKAQAELELARLRLIQAKIAAKHNNTVAMESALDAHNKLLERVNATIKAISNKKGNITGLERAIQVHERRIELLNEILAKVNLTEAERAKIEVRLGHVENVTEKLKALQEKLQNKTVKNETEEGNETAEQKCINSGGNAIMSTCSYNISNFYNTCPIGTCPPGENNSYPVKICDCGVDKCFNGEKCVTRAEEAGHWCDNCNKS